VVDQSLRSPLKVAIIPTFRGIVVQVRIFGLEKIMEKIMEGGIMGSGALFLVISRHSSLVTQVTSNLIKLNIYLAPSIYSFLMR
jgi:hypothetical protein